MKNQIFASPPTQKTWLLRAVVCIALLAALWLAWGLLRPAPVPETDGSAAPTAGRGAGGGRQEQSPAIPVRTERVVIGNFPVFFSGLGTVTANNTVTVRSRVDGELLRLHFTDGQMVKVGDLLAEIDPRSYQAQLEQIQGQVLRDQALLRNARQNLARSKILLPQDSTTPQQVDNQEAIVRQYEGITQINQGQLDAARLQLSYTKITAPISGRLGIRLVDAGNIIRAGDSNSNAIAVITEVQPINVMFTVTESQLPALLASMKSDPALLVEAWDRTQSTLIATGRLVTTDNLIDTSTGTVRVKAEFSNTDNSLFPNQFVNARLRVSTIENALIAPTAAIQLGNQGNFVYLVGDDRRVELRPVKLGPGNDTRTVISSGVAEGDMLVIDGLDRLRDKSLVTVVNTPARPAAQGAAQEALQGAAPGAKQGNGQGSGQSGRQGKPPATAGGLEKKNSGGQGKSRESSEKSAGGQQQ